MKFIKLQECLTIVLRFNEEVLYMIEHELRSEHLQNFKRYLQMEEKSKATIEKILPEMVRYT